MLCCIAWRWVQCHRINRDLFMGNIFRRNCFSCYNNLMRECVSCHVLQFHINKNVLTTKTNVFIICMLLIYYVTDVQCLNTHAYTRNKHTLAQQKKHPWNKYALAQCWPNENTTTLTQHWPNGSVVQIHVGPTLAQ